jgi:NADH dehydrogenase
MAAQRIVVVGAGFAGLWSALGAARKLDELGVPAQEVEILVVNRDSFHGLRVRNYEADLGPTRVPLADLLEPVGVKLLLGEATGIDLPQRQLQVQTSAGVQTVGWDRLVLATGGPLLRPNVPGLAEQAFDIDTYAGAERLQQHLAGLAARSGAGRGTVLVVGGGLVGIEIACELPERLQAAGVPADEARVILADRSDHIGSTMGPHAIPVIAEALQSLGVQTRTGVSIAAIDRSGATLASGERIEAATVVWCAGMRASPLAAELPGEHDRFGRLVVDKTLRAPAAPGVFAAGDVAALDIDQGQCSVMSCQHGRPMGRFAGHNAVCDLLELPLLPLAIDWYVTVLDLGPWGALYTEGWDRRVVTVGPEAKRTKRIINGQRIVPPLNRDRQALLAAAAPVVQSPPEAYLRHTRD